MESGEIVEITEYNKAGGKMGKGNRNFGQEVGDELISGLPLALGICRGIVKGVTNTTQILRDKVLTEEELEAIREEESRKADNTDSSGIIGNLKAINRNGIQAGSNLTAVGRSLMNKAINKSKKEQ